MGDDQTMSPIEGATVTLVGLGQATLTAANGTFAFPDADVEDIRVLRGPASSTLAGSYALEGAIYITTKSGTYR